jgi:hypothetical protein
MNTNIEPNVGNPKQKDINTIVELVKHFESCIDPSKPIVICIDDNGAHANGVGHIASSTEEIPDSNILLLTIDDTSKFPGSEKHFFNRVSPYFEIINKLIELTTDLNVIIVLDNEFTEKMNAVVGKIYTAGMVCYTLMSRAYNKSMSKGSKMFIFHSMRPVPQALISNKGDNISYIKKGNDGPGDEGWMELAQCIIEFALHCRTSHPAEQ